MMFLVYNTYNFWVAYGSLAEKADAWYGDGLLGILQDH